MTRRVILKVVLVVAFVLAATAILVAALNFRDEEAIPDIAPPFTATRKQVERGEYLARAGNCIACHTARGGAPYAGGLSVRTPFGTVVSTNLTPHYETGIGSWT